MAILNKAWYFFNILVDKAFIILLASISKFRI